MRDVELLKLRLLDGGLSITPAARSWLDDHNDGRPLTPADYASTSGIILRLEDDVWVNAPTHDHNPNFVAESGDGIVLDVISDARLVVRDGDDEVKATFWKPPRYHGETGSDDKPYNRYVFSHGDRVRLSPIQGCSMVCKFCNIPYEDRYDTKPLAPMLEALQVALDDEIQPAHHILISGGTPHPRHHDYLKGVYRAVLDRYAADYDVDIMMVPVDGVGGLLDVGELSELGLHALSVNIEAINADLARSFMRQKLQRGLDEYLEFIEHAAGFLGEGRVRSMLMVGLEPYEDTLRGVQLILDAGGTPVLSPFRPDPVTPLHDLKPPTVADLADIWQEASRLASAARPTADHPLGPACPPCTHNTVTFLGPDPHYPRPAPNMI